MSRYRSLVNTAGEPEQDRLGRRANLLEGLGIITVALVILWPMAFAGDILGGHHWITGLVTWIIRLLAVWIFVISPLWHGDTPESWGLGNPRKLLATLVGKNHSGNRLQLGIIVVLLFVALNLAIYLLWPDVAKGLKLHRMGFATDPRSWNESFPGRFFVLGTALLISSIVVGVLIRYDNFGTAFRTGMKIWFPILMLMFLAAWLHRGSAAFSRLSLSDWLLGVLAYVFWGAFQQLIFSGYLGTRFRKGIGPPEKASNAVSREKRARVRLGFSLLFAVVGISAVAGAIAVLYGREKIDPGALLWIAAIFALGGLAYGHWFCQDKKRLLVATLTGACFGLIHIDSYGLVVLTWALGTILSYIFMKDTNRNVFALGFIHGILGSTLSSLFSKSESGVLEIDYHVGPWNVDNPTPGTLIFPLLCIAAFGIAIFRTAGSDTEMKDRAAPPGTA